MTDPPLGRRALAEFIGTGMLLAAILGSGIAAQRLSPGDVGLELLENAFATSATLAAIILTFAPVSGAHLNPAVKMADFLLRRMSRRTAGVYVGAQLAGAALGAVLANAMVSLPAVEISTKGTNLTSTTPSRRSGESCQRLPHSWKVRTRNQLGPPLSGKRRPRPGAAARTRILSNF